MLHASLPVNAALESEASASHESDFVHSAWQSNFVGSEHESVSSIMHTSQTHMCSMHVYM